MSTNLSETRPVPSWRAIQWWPAGAALAFAAFVAADLFRGEETGTDLAAVVVASGLVYLAAAAIGRPAVAWPAFILSVIIITAARIGAIAVDPTWLLLGVAGLLFIFGILRSGMRTEGLPLQSLAMAGFGAAAAASLFVDARLGAYLVATALFAHALWDAYHHWTNRVVVRSLAEFCAILDLALAGAIVVTTLRG